MGAAAGLEDIAEHPSLVGEALVAAMAKGEFHAFPDCMAPGVDGDRYSVNGDPTIEIRVHRRTSAFHLRPLIPPIRAKPV